MPINDAKKPFTEIFILMASTNAGVYALWDNNELIYYGKGEGVNGIKARLEAHKRGSEGPCTQFASTFQQEESYNPSARERELLQEYRASHFRLPRCNDVMP